MTPQTARAAAGSGDRRRDACRYDQCLVTTSPALLARLAPDLPPDYLQGLLELKSMGAVVMVLALKHQLSEQGYYWYNMPKSAGFPFLALVEHTNFVPPEHFGGDHIVYMGDYLEPDHEYFRLSQEELLERFLPALPALQPRFLTRLGAQDLAVPHALCPAGAAGEPFAQYPRHPDPHARAVFCQHEPGVPLGSRHQLCREIGRRAARQMLADRL